MTTHRTGFIASGWAFVSGAVALVWTLTGDGFPFGDNNDVDPLHPLRTLPSDIGAPLFAVVSLAVAVMTFAMAGRHPVRPLGALRHALLGFGWLVAVLLLVAVPGPSVLAIAGYAPMLLIGLPFGWPDVDYGTVFTWTLACEVWAIAGGLLLAATLLTWQRRTAGSCVACGRRAAGETWTSAESAARWGRWAAYVAALCPAVYAFTRLTWALGIPLGLDADMVRETDVEIAAAGLGGFALVGSVLTLGLVARWGERFPRWVVGLAGRRVPIRLATVPAVVVAVAVASASAGFLASEQSRDMIATGSLSVLPMVLWPLWSVALVAAAYAYHLRRRGSCPACGRRGPAVAAGGHAPPPMIKASQKPSNDFRDALITGKGAGAQA